MEVLGRRSLTDTCNVFCKHCGDENKRVPADGLCQECEEHMCRTCFGNHKTYKVCKDHIMLDIDTAIKAESHKEEDIFVPCPKHIKEQVKFYCTRHNDVGCGDCMILYHKTCKLDYIAEICNEFRERKDFKDNIQHVNACQTEVNECCELIKNNSIQVDDIHQRVISEINSFRDELMSKLDKLETKVLEEANGIHNREKLRITSLEAECKQIKDELTVIHDKISSNCSPINLFINTVQSKSAINEIQLKLCKLRSRGTINKYHFKKNDKVQELLKELQLGGIHIDNGDETQEYKGYEAPVVLGNKTRTLQECDGGMTKLEEGYVNTRKLPTPPADDVFEGNKHLEHSISYEKVVTHNEKVEKSNNVYEDTLSVTDPQEYEELIYEEITQTKPASKRRSSKRKTPSLFENQLRCENILMAGEIVSFKENSKGDLGLFIGKRSIKAKTYFEIEIMHTSDRGNISIGFVPKDYSSKEQPGDGRFSMAFHSVDGSIHCDSASKKRLSPPCKVGDVLGIGVSSYLTNVFKTSISLFVTRNSKKIGSMDMNNPSFCKLYPAVGLKTINDKGRVILDAEVP